MNSHHLRYARAVMETFSFSRAAEQCHVSQPSLSIAVAQLEQELGERLFVRSTRRVELTPFGAYLAPFFDEAVRGLDEVRLAAERFRGTTETVIRVGLSPLIDARLLNHAIEPFKRKWSGMKVIFKECMLEDLDQRLATQGIDVSCTIRQGRARAGSCPLYSDHLLYLPPGGSQRSARRSVPIRHLASEIFVLTVDGCGLSNAVRSLFHRNRVRLHEYQGHALSYDVVEEWVELGIGAGILPESKVRKLKQCAQPILRNDGRQACLSYELRWNRKRQLPDYVEAFIEHIRDVVPSLRRGAAWDRAEGRPSRRHTIGTC